MSMFHHKLFVLGFVRGAVLLFLNLVNVLSQERVIGGRNAKLGQFPSVVSIRFGILGHNCGGTLITLKDVLTAAHCVTYGSRVVKAYMFIVAGEVRSADVENTTLQTGVIGSVIMHPMYNCLTFENDIAVLKLVSPLAPTDSVKPLARATNNPSVNQECIVVGWGAKDPIVMEVAEVLQYATVNVLFRLHCELRGSNHPFNDQSMICAGVPLKKGVCLGDSGSPLICDGKLAGVTSAALMPCVVVGGGGRFSSAVYFGKFIDTFVEWDGQGSPVHKLREFIYNDGIVNSLFRNATALLILLRYL